VGDDGAAGVQTLGQLGGELRVAATQPFEQHAVRINLGELHRRTTENEAD
jgi:hypothetical protein